MSYKKFYVPRYSHDTVRNLETEITCALLSTPFRPTMEDFVDIPEPHVSHLEQKDS